MLCVMAPIKQPLLQQGPGEMIANMIEQTSMSEYMFPSSLTHERNEFGVISVTLVACTINMIIIIIDDFVNIL
jgi:hypothetical protein